MHGPGAGSLPALEESSLLLQPEIVGFSLMQDQYSGVLIYEILTIFLLNMNNQKAHFKKHKEKKSAKTTEPFHLFSLFLPVLFDPCPNSGFNAQFPCPD